MKIVISSGHGKYVRGASGFIDEVEEARKVVDEVADRLTVIGHEVVTFHDDESTTQSENLNRIVNFHNEQDPHDVDVSVHFNAYMETSGGMGTEVCYITQGDVAAKVSAAISSASGLINRGAKYRSDLYFLNGTVETSILIEVCFVDSEADVEAYQKNFDEICQAIANVATSPEDFDMDVIKAKGKVSWFGGPEDTGVSPSEGLAFIYDVEDKPHLFLPNQPPGTTGLARRLDPNTYYFAMRWDYDQFSKDELVGDAQGLIRSHKTGKKVMAHPADWGPHTSTNRVADTSPAVLTALGIQTDDEVEIIYPFTE
jgi:N-acetylmuramoyl-L-alanine amidase